MRWQAATEGRDFGRAEKGAFLHRIKRDKGSTTCTDIIFMMCERHARRLAGAEKMSVPNWLDRRERGSASKFTHGGEKLGKADTVTHCVIEVV